MRTIIISYSLSGNNEALASSIAGEIGAQHIRLKELKSRTMWTITWDVLFNRTPKITPIENLEAADLVLFIGPVWMGHVATPFRGLFKELKNQIKKYGYIAISGGADGDNVNLKNELINRIGKGPMVLVDLHIADLLPQEPKPERKDTMHYQLTEEDVKQLTNKTVSHLEKTVLQNVAL